MSDKMLIIILIALGLIFCSVFRIVPLIQTTKQKRRARKERWGEFIEPESGISWNLGRVVINRGNRNDSLPYLESWGFKFLGYVDEVMLQVEPPKDWKKILNGTCWESILDENRKIIFNHLYKNDPENRADYRAEIQV